MKLIVESGSTKTNWALVDKNSIQTFHSDGWNPATLDKNKFLFPEFFEKAVIKSIHAVHYYGAGIRNEEIKNLVVQKFREVGFTANTEVSSDLLGAARACCGHSTGWIGILGTGSNLGYYDGHNLNHLSPSLGFILGDEGSGFAIGKTILRHYFNGKMPEEVKKIFENHYLITADEVIHSVYQGAAQNAYVASFTAFLNHVNGDWKQEILASVFQEFFDYKVLPFKNASVEIIHFCGSVACHFQNELKETALQNGMKIGKIIASPLEALVTFHQS